MKFLIENWWLIAIAISAGGMLLWPMLGSGGSAGLTPASAVQAINREKAVVVDVCEPAEFAAGHVVGAKNIPLSELETRLPSAVKNKGLPLILVCQSGARSARAVATAKKLGYDNTRSMAGGMGAWRAANLPVEKT